MNLPFYSSKTRHLALTGDTKGAVLTELLIGPNREPRLHVLASGKNISITDEKQLARLLESVPERVRGEVSIALPLSFFTTKNLTLPVMPKEAIGQALPYHLAKVSDRPLNELIYDWQITHFEKNNLKLVVYLLERKIFMMMKQTLAEKQMELAYLECDLFAAYALLERQKRLPETDAAMCLLFWSDSISMAIHENHRLTVVRSLPLEHPNRPYAADEQEEGNHLEAPVQHAPARPLEPPPMPQDDYLDLESTSSLLAGFDIIHHAADDETQTNKTQKLSMLMEGPPTQSERDANPKVMTRWSDYLNQVNLEIVRTRDYYRSVVKGSSIQHIFIGGAEDFFDDLQSLVKGTTTLDLEPLSLTDYQSADCPQSFGAICAGTGARW